MKRMISLLLSLMLLVAAGCAPATSAEDTPAGGRTLTRFRYSIWGDLMPRSWEITLREDGYWLQAGEGTPRPFPEALAAELTRAIAESGADSWQGEYETEYMVLDGEGFSLEIDYADGVSVSATGENAFPDHYFSFQGAVLGLFERAVMAELAGVYRYEGEGMGGDFTITLSADGSYTFDEGPLSSYLGAGAWRVYDSAVYLTEGEAGDDLSFAFGVEEDALVYLADGSDAFIYVQVRDGERFVKQ